MVELTCERRSWQVLSPLGTTRMAAAPRPAGGKVRPSTAYAVAVLLVAVVLVPAAMIALEASTSEDVSWLGLLLVPVVLLVLVVAGLAAHALGSSWWHNGAGSPVLQVDGGIVRGRLRSARRSGPAYDGWDFEVPVASLTAVRVTGAGHLAVGLPPALEEELLDHPDTRVHARQWRAVTGSPASWPASRMLSPRHRAERLGQLTAALTPTPSPGAGT